MDNLADASYIHRFKLIDSLGVNTLFVFYKCLSVLSTTHLQVFVSS